MNPLISVIIPVYKVEEYLKECLDSVINQTYKNLEIILVDDGSPDNCPQICDEYAGRDNRIKVIHKQNGGVSDARNAGIDIACGKFISFIDSDDSIDEKFYEILYKNIKECNADISFSGVNYVNKRKNKQAYNFPETRVMKRDEAIEWTAAIFNGYVCNKLFKKSVFNNIRFPDDVKWGEDMIVTLKTLTTTDSIVFAKEALYNYKVRKSSATLTVVDEDISSFFDAMEKQKDELIKLNPQMNKTIRLLTFGYNTAYVGIISSLKQPRAKAVVKSIRKEAFFILSCKSISLNRKAGLILLFINKYLYKGVKNLKMRLYKRKCFN